MAASQWGIAGLIVDLFVRPVNAASAPPVATNWQKPAQSVANAGITLLGFYTNIVDKQHLTIYPYWWVTERTSQLRCRWQVISADGMRLVESVSKPYFNTLGADTFLANSIVDDAHYVNLPPGTKEGDYQLWLQLEEVTANGSVMVLPLPPRSTR